MERYTLRTGLIEIVLVATALLFIVPIVGLVNVALKAPSNFTTALAFEGEYTFENFLNAWNQGSLGAALLNSVAVTGATVVLVVMVGSMASYFLARRSGNWSRATFYFFLAGLALPAQLGLLPLYRTMIDLGLVGSIWGVVIFNVGAGLPFTIFLFTTFLRSLPSDYEEAALLDGASVLQSFLHVVLPLMRPALGTVAILNAISSWNGFLVPLLYLSGTGVETVPVRLYGFVGQYTSNWPMIFAGLLLTVLPILVAFFFLQRSVMQGFAGGLKG